MNIINPKRNPLLSTTRLLTFSISNNTEDNCTDWARIMAIRPYNVLFGIRQQTPWAMRCWRVAPCPLPAFSERWVSCAVRMEIKILCVFHLILQISRASSQGLKKVLFQLVFQKVLHCKTVPTYFFISHFLYYFFLWFFSLMSSIPLSAVFSLLSSFSSSPSYSLSSFHHYPLQKLVMQAPIHNIDPSYWQFNISY